MQQAATSCLPVPIARMAGLETPPIPRASGLKQTHQLHESPACSLSGTLKRATYFQCSLVWCVPCNVSSSCTEWFLVHQLKAIMNIHKSNIAPTMVTIYEPFFQPE